jgi:hypothetical protein
VFDVKPSGRPRNYADVSALLKKRVIRFRGKVTNIRPAEFHIARIFHFFKGMWILFSPDISISWLCTEIYRTFDQWRRNAKFGKVRSKHARACRLPAVSSTHNSLMKIGWYLVQPFFFTCRSEVLRNSNSSSFLVIHHTHKLTFFDDKWIS